MIRKLCQYFLSQWFLTVDQSIWGTFQYVYEDAILSVDEKSCFDDKTRIGNLILEMRPSHDVLVVQEIPLWRWDAVIFPSLWRCHLHVKMAIDKHFQIHFLEWRLKFHGNLFLRVQLTSQHSFRLWLGIKQAPSHYLNQWWPILLMHKCVTLPQSVYSESAMATFIIWFYDINSAYCCLIV